MKKMKTNRLVVVLMFALLMPLSACGTKEVFVNFPENPIYLHYKIPAEKIPLDIAMLVDSEVVQPYTLTYQGCGAAPISETIPTGRSVPQLFNVFLAHHFNSVSVLTEKQLDSSAYSLLAKVKVSKIMKNLRQLNLLKMGCQVYLELDVSFQDNNDRLIFKEKVTGKNMNECVCAGGADEQERMYDPAMTAAMNKAFEALSEKIKNSKELSTFSNEASTAKAN